MAAETLSSSTSNGDQRARPGFRAGLIGQGIQLSRTPKMHIDEGRAQGIDYRYDLIETAGHPGDPDIADLLNRAEDEGYCGVNITYPFKRAVVALVDQLSETAEAIGAINTIVFRDGSRSGHNTDCWGFAEAFRTGMADAKRDRVLLLGAGGAGRAVAQALVDLGVGKLVVHDSDPVAAAALVSTLAGRAGDESVVQGGDLGRELSEADGIVNATPVGMASLPGSPVPVHAIRPHHWVADIIYFPLETELLAAARATGCRVLNGSGMAVFQAARAFELFTGLKPDSKRMRATFDAFSD